MQLAITILGQSNDGVVDAVIFATTSSQTHIVDLKSSLFNTTNCAYLLIEGNWNQLSKFESTLHAIQKKFDCSIHSHRVEAAKEMDVMPMTVEVIGLASSGLLSKITQFFRDRGIEQQEVSARTYPAPYLNAQLMSAKFIVTLGNDSLFQLRDELMYLCDSLNADLLFEPFKMGV
ncbi:MAG: hypothetical protein PHQ03_08875 [Methylococcales bacterium]|nr:hypothetical protein [Methylococcales bacterium]